MTRGFSSSSSDADNAPLFVKQFDKNYVQRAMDIIILLLMVSMLSYRFLEGPEAVTWRVAMACELWFTFVWILSVSTKWNPMRYLTFPQLAIYVSDDACSPVTFVALSETSKFAQQWVPFCRKYDIQVRAPFQYFAPGSKQPVWTDGDSNSIEFQNEWEHMKNEYEKLSRKINDASKESAEMILPAADFAVFAKTELNNHPPIVKIIWENREDASHGLPHLVYVSREKRPKHQHHYKAGAMNALIRVSGLMTNAPFMLNVDCDMYVNNPRVALHALCLLLDPTTQDDTAFVQYPQRFYDGLKDDPFGNQYVVFLENFGRGIASIQGPLYSGTNCFHRRKVMYGAMSKTADSGKKDDTSVGRGNFGSSEEFVKSVTDTFKDVNGTAKDLSGSLEAAHHVASCGYEFGTLWGRKIGLIYGSTTEDIFTGMTIHSRGWKSAHYSSEPPGFQGCAPTGGPESLIQMKRWSTGLLEILTSKSNPITAALFGRLQFRQCLAYIYILIWNIRSIPELIYALLPAYSIITNSHIFPKVQEPAILIPASIFLTYNIYTLSEFLRCSLSPRAWWNNQRMDRIKSASSWLFGVLGVALKLLGTSETVFEITKKEQSTSNDHPDADKGRFTFDDSPIFVPGTALLLVQLGALAMLVLGMQPAPGASGGPGPAEAACSLWIVLSFWPFLRGLLEKGKYGVPLKTIYKAATLASVFVLFSILTPRISPA